MVRQLLSFITTVCILATGFYMLWQASFSTKAELESRYKPMTRIPFASIDKRIINAVLLGHGIIYDNFIHLWVTQFLSSEETLTQDPDKVSAHLKKLLPLKIKSESFYLFTCFRFIFDFKRAELCHPFANAGMRVFADNWLIPATQGYAYLVDQRFSEAALLFEVTATKPGAPGYFKTVGPKILNKNEVDFSVPQKILEQMEKSGTTQSIINKLNKR